jgi:hypothetical protein
MWFTVLAACRPDPTAELRQEPPIAGCEATTLQFLTSQNNDGETLVSAEVYLEQRLRWDGEERVVEEEIAYWAVPSGRYEAKYDAHDNLVEEYTWFASDAYSLLQATEVAGPQVLEYTFEWGTEDEDERVVELLDTYSLVWSGGAWVATMWDQASDGVMDASISYHGWETPDRWSMTESTDLGLDGSVDYLTGTVGNGAFDAAIEEWSDAPIGGVLETRYLADVDEHGRTWSAEWYEHGELQETCTYEWDGLVLVESICETGGDVPKERERAVRIDDADGREGEREVYAQELLPPGQPEILESVDRVRWSCPAAG